MSDTVLIAVVNGLVTIVVVVLSRWHSSREHKITSNKLDKTMGMVNGRMEQLINDAIKRSDPPSAK